MISALKLRTYFSALLLMFVGTLLVTSRAAAQGASVTASPAQALPPESRAVVERLMSLSELPDGVWITHSGDLAHGEDVNLDESGWQPIALGAKTSNEAVWFRQTIKVPGTLHGYDLSGARIWFQFHAAANGPMPEMIYFNGRRVALGDDLEPIVLFDSARPGDQITVAVKLLHTVDAKTFRGATLRIDFPANRPNPVDLAEEFLSAAVLLPSLAPGDTAKLATLESAIGAVDVAALDAHDQSRFDDSLKTAQEKLEPLRPLLQQATFHLTGNSHIDAAWLWPRTETVDVVRRTFSTALQLMDEYPGYTFTQSAAQYNAWMAAKYPDMNAEIAQRIKEGRWEVVGGMWVEPDLNMPTGESLVRQLLVGKRWYEQAYGVDVRVGWNPDSFGYNWQLPQIYKKSGVDFFVTQKMSWNDINQLPFKLFWWESPDGSKVLTYFPHGYGNGDLGPVRLSSDLAIARKYSPGLTDMMDLYGVGDHGGGPTRAMLDQGFHWADPGATAVAANGGTPVTPKYQFGTALAYFTSIEKQIAPSSPVWNYQSIAKGYEPPPAVPGKISIPTWDSELYLEFHRGVYTTQANHKHNMRTAEEEMLNAEKWSSLAWLDGNSYPGAELTEDWKKVLFNQFHDLAAGSGIGVIYKDAQKDYDWVRMSTNEIDGGALDTVTERIDTTTRPANTGVPIVVFNPLGWTRSGAVVVTVQLPKAEPGRTFFPVVDPSRKGERLANTVLSDDPETGVVSLRIEVPEVPGLGSKVIYVLPGAGRATKQPTPVSMSQTTDGLTLENESVRVTVNRSTGCISSLIDKRTNFEALASGGCGNQLQLFKDMPKQFDAWNIDPGTLNETPTLLDKPDSVAWNEPKSSRPGIRVIYTWQHSRFQQTTRLSGDEVDLDSQIDWHERHVLLKAAFPLAVTSNFATYEIPYGTIERPTTRNNSWEKAQYEVPALRWADLSGMEAGAGPDGKVYGLSVLNQDKYGYDAVGNLLRLTLLRSPTWPDPEADQGHHHFHYALYPHAGTWKDALTVRHGWEYDYPLEAVVTTAHAGPLPPEHSFASVSPDNVVLTAVKKAEDDRDGMGGLIFRVYEWAGKQSTVEFHVPPGAAGATVTNLMEQPEGGPLAVTTENGGDVVNVPIHPYEILTLRVDYPKGGPQP